MSLKTCKRCGSAKAASEFRADPRYASGFGSWCCACHRQRNSEWARENRARLTAKAVEWRRDNPGKVKDVNVRHKRANKPRLAAEHAAWAKANRDKRRATDAKRKAAKLMATPSWADQAAIAEIYRRATEIERATGDRMHVDHIIPLQHPLVCGLHCEANLQILPGSVNEAKRNKFEPFIEPPKPAKQEAMF